ATHLCEAVPPTGAHQCHPPVPSSATHLCPTVPPTCAQQCPPPVPPISAVQQCHPSDPSISATHQCCLSVLIRAAYQCPSLLHISGALSVPAHQCRLSVLPI
ncbi:unnamed protein product, partial [Staurois parvus]